MRQSKANMNGPHNEHLQSGQICVPRADIFHLQVLKLRVNVAFRSLSLQWHTKWHERSQKVQWKRTAMLHVDKVTIADDKIKRASPLLCRILNNRPNVRKKPKSSPETARALANQPNSSNHFRCVVSLQKVSKLNEYFFVSGIAMCWKSYFHSAVARETDLKGDT